MVTRRFTQREDSDAEMWPFATARDLGLQFVKTDLEADLVRQLAFCWRVRELVTQPVICDRRGAAIARPDLYLRTDLDRDAGCSVDYVVYVREDGERRRAIDDVGRLRAWCAATDTRLRIVGETEIRTPYLENARLLERYANAFPDGEPDAMGVLWTAMEDGPITVANAVADIVHLFAGVGYATRFVEACVAKEIVACDLSTLFSQDTKISSLTEAFAETNRYVPILRLIEAADDGRGRAVTST